MPWGHAEWHMYRVQSSRYSYRGRVRHAYICKTYTKYSLLNIHTVRECDKHTFVRRIPHTVFKIYIPWLRGWYHLGRSLCHCTGAVGDWSASCQIKSGSISAYRHCYKTVKSSKSCWQSVDVSTIISSWFLHHSSFCKLSKVCHASPLCGQNVSPKIVAILSTLLKIFLQ